MRAFALLFLAAISPLRAASPVALSPTGESGELQFSWAAVTSPAGITGYQIYRATFQNLSLTAPVAYSTGLSYLDTGLTDGIRYWMAVAGDALGATQSVPVSATPFALPVGAPNVTLTALSFGAGINVQWGPVQTHGYNVGAYRIEQGSSGTFTTIRTLAASVTQTTLSFACATGVTLKVRAVDVLGSTGVASSASAASFPCAPSVTPLSLTSSALSLLWTAAPAKVNPTLQYQIRYATFSGAAYSDTSLDQVTPLAAAITTLVPQGSSRWYQVYQEEAVSGVLSAASNEVAVMAAPSGLSFTATGRQGRVLLDWARPAAALVTGISNYQVFYATYVPPVPAALGTSVTTVYDPGASASFVHATVTALTNGTAYYFGLASKGGAVTQHTGALGVTVSATPSLPAPVINSMTQSLGGPISLTWSIPDISPSTFTAYKVFVATDSFLTTKSLLATVNSVTTSSALVAQPSSPNSHWFVQVSNSADESSSPTASVFYAPVLAAPVLSVDLTSNARVYLSWTADASATEYQVYRATQGVTGTAAAFLPLALVQSNVFIDTKPVNGQADLYQVLARRKLSLSAASKLESALSLSQSAMPEVGPGIPGAYLLSGAFAAYLTATVRSNTGIVDLSWAPSATGSRLISRYLIYQGRSVSSLDPTPIATVFSPLTTFARVTQDPASQAYGVEAVDVSGTVSLRLTGTAAAFGPWPAPRSPSAQVLSSGVKLTWSAPLGSGSYPSSAYVVYRRDLFSSTNLAVSSVAGTSYLDVVPAASRASQLSYFIGAFDSKGIVGALTGVAAAFSVPAFTGLTPSAPVSVTARTLTGTAIAGFVPVLLQWQPNPEAEGVTSTATGYALYRGATHFADTTATSMIDLGAAIDSSVSYGVQAVNSAGAGLTSTATPASLGIDPPQPSFVAIDYTIAPTANPTLAYRLSWQDLGIPSGVDAYKVYRGTVSLGSFSVANMVDNNVGSAGAYVSYTVVSLIGSSESASPVAGVVLTVTAAVIPLNLSASVKSGTVRLDWSPQGQTRTFWVYRSTNAVSATPGIPVYASTAAATYTDSPVDANFIWNYAVSAVNELGQSLASTLSVTPLPGVISGLTLTAGYSGTPQVALAWTEPGSPLNATGYEVWRGSDLAAMASIAQLASPVTSYVDPAPLSNTAQFYQVRAYNLGPSLGFPTAGPVKTFDPPAMPQGLRASGGLNRIDVAWDPPAAAQGVTGYAMSFAAAGSTSTVSLNLPAQPNAVALTGLAAATSYSVTLTAKGSGGYSALTDTSAETNAVGPVASPLGFNAKVGFYDAIKVNLTWSPLGNGETAIIYRATGPIAAALAAGGPASPLYLTGSTGSIGQVLDASPSLVADQDYYYALTALGAGGFPGAESLPIHTGPVKPFVYPLAVQLTVTAGLNRVELQWSPPSSTGTDGLSVTPYRVYRYQQNVSYTAFGNFAPDAGFPLQSSGTVMTDTQVTAGAKYQYFVTVVDGLGREQDRGEGRLGIIPQGPPGTPPQPLAVAGDSSVALRWLALKSDTDLGLKFNVYRRLTGTGEDYGAPVASLFQVGPSSVEFQGALTVVMTVRDKGDNTSLLSPGSLVNKTTYCYTLSQVNEAGEGGKSGEACATPYKPLKPSLLNLDIAVVGKKDVRLSWDSQMEPGASYPGSPQIFRVFRSIDGGTTYTVLQDVTVTTHTDKQTSFGASYTYRVVPIDTQGNEGYSYNLADIVIPAALNSLLIFRNSFNPAQGEVAPIQYSLVQPGHAWVRLYTLQGEFVVSLFDEDVPLASVESPYLSLKKDWDGHNAAGQTVASGVYMVHLEAPGYRANARVAVIK
jgi:fibronectin type 3 domain-containing protein